MKLKHLNLVFTGSMIALAMLYAVQANALSACLIDGRGRSIVGATVTVKGLTLEAITDEQGCFYFDETGFDEIHIEAEGFSHEIIHLHGAAIEEKPIVLTRTVVEQVDVIGTPLHLSTIESAQPVSVLKGTALRDKQASTLGETLKYEVGVNMTYYGPSANSPIIRGLGGSRVLITQNGLDVGDLSRSGVDHAITTEASTATQIEILRGPSTLFYGSGAIGGVVNVVDNRVPDSGETEGEFSITRQTVSNENAASVSYTTGHKQLAVHFDGYWRNGDPYKIPEDARAHPEEGDRLANSQFESNGYNLGLSWLFSQGYVGLSYGFMANENGVPGHESHEGSHIDESAEWGEDDDHHTDSVISDMEQDRVQLIGEINLSNSFISAINTRVSYSQYDHLESHLETQLDEGIEGFDGADHKDEDGTIFENESAEFRLDLTHQEMSGWRGAFTLQSKYSDQAMEGVEAFTPPFKQTQVAFAWVEELHWGQALWQLGARIEQVEIKADLENDLAGVGHQTFNPKSASAGVVWTFLPGYNITASLTHSERGPSGSELFAAGPHTATATFEIGANYQLAANDAVPQNTIFSLIPTDKGELEISNNLDLGFRRHYGDVGVILNGYFNQINDFYFLQNTGLSMADIGNTDAALPVYSTVQEDVEISGLEGEFIWQVNARDKLTLWGDLVHGKLKSGGSLPRMPPPRLGIELHSSFDRWQVQLAFVNYFDQNKLAENEDATEGYGLLSGQVSYRVKGIDGISLFLKGDNLTNQAAYVHSSYIKEDAPLPGRGLTLGARAVF